MLHDTAPAVRLDAVEVAYGAASAVGPVTGIFERGQLHAIVGPNGAGKSSLLGALAGHLPAAGCITIASDLRDRIGWLPQRTQIDRSFPIQVDDFAALGLWPRIGAFGAVGVPHRRAIDGALTRLGLQGLQRRLIGELSTGQFQRLLFARLCLQDARLLLLDEPFTALDERTATDMLALLHEWQREGRTVIAVLHEHAVVHDHFTNMLLLARQPMAWGAPAEALTADAWQHAQACMASHQRMAEVAA
ncbi:ATP-binding cassette domain-containing protein [Aquincola sp. MAHUQ-54]|uniref:ATP-binding cassette domain-containing protein n=1 Tax=Aquincola agrisoli TaxID=3119538 RepID=A0AAW9QES9_9BURK